MPREKELTIGSASDFPCISHMFIMKHAIRVTSDTVRLP